MSNYLTNSLTWCYGFNGTSDDISVKETVSLVRNSDGEVMDGYSPISIAGVYKEGETYTAKKFWVITKSYNLIARFETKEAAEAEFNRIIEELKGENNVIVVNSDKK